MQGREHFDALVGTEGPYEGADESNSIFKFAGIKWMVLEDEADGYRSFLDGVIYAGQNANIIEQPQLATVRLDEIVEEDEQYGEPTFTGYHLVDVKTNHVWLEIGTSYFDSYYPCMVFRHNPITQ